jgi:hypothetical protein
MSRIEQVLQHKAVLRQKVWHLSNKQAMRLVRLYADAVLAIRLRYDEAVIIIDQL